MEILKSSFSIFIVLSLLVCAKARADISLDLNGISFQDALTTTNNPKATRLYYDFGIGISLYNKSSFYFGMSYVGFNSTDVDSSAITTTWSAADLGAFIKYYLGRQRMYSITLGYGIQANANYTLGSATTEKWSGTGTSVRLSYLPPMTENLSFGLSLLYYMGAYKTSRSGSTVTDISKTRTYLLPLIGITYDF